MLNKTIYDILFESCFLIKNYRKHLASLYETRMKIGVSCYKTVFKLFQIVDHKIYHESRDTWSTYCVFYKVVIDINCNILFISM